MPTQTKQKQKSEQAVTLVNDSVRALKAYHLTPEECGIKLNQNENPCDWPQDVKRAAADFFVRRPWNRYPNFIPEELRAALARHAGGGEISAENVIVGNGSNEMLLVLLLSFAAKAKSVIICQPTFTVYRLLAEGMGAKAVNVSLTEDLQYDACGIKKAAAGNPGAILVICSPNNPVGNVIAEDDLRGILDAHTGICIFDQAYMEFGGFDGVKLLADYPNLIVTRTFSKAMAGAGLRLGYMIGNADLITEINKIKLPYNINFFTEHAASTILNNVSIVKDTVKMLVDERDSLYQYLKTKPFGKVYPSEANFILVRTPKKQELFGHLRGDGILVRDVSSYPLLENCLRISVGTKEENLKLRESIDKFFNRGN
ncbi:MAG: histidinol-phosphate transaminase [Chitinispirillia bacterium]|nr:histidinol-phosphate transaminase [Chitinispirillia bacterium]MCL2241159.1 histidinol-phosphate transaminase [Chitinispirillia bacterium]